jgi:hypothetical protein
VLSAENKESLTFYEEWGIRVGQYGASQAYEAVEFLIEQPNLTKNPHIATLSSLAIASLKMMNQSSAATASTTTVDVNNYDVAGTTTSIPTNKYTILRIFSLVNNEVIIQRNPRFVSIMADYERVLKQRNSVLKSIKNLNSSKQNKEIFNQSF